MAHRLQTTLALAGTLGLSLSLLAGCGGASTASPPASSAKKSSTPASGSQTGSTNQTLIPIKIGKAVNVVSFTIADIAQKEGFFKQQGISAKLLIMHGSSNANAALVGGSLQFTMADSIPLAIARAKGVPLVAVEGIDHGISEQLIVSKKWIKDHHLSTTMSVDQRMKGLEGITYGYAGATDQKLFSYMMKKAGANPSTVKAVSLGGGAEEATAMSHGSIDAFQISPPTSFQVVAQGSGVDYLNYEKVFGKMEYDLVMTSEQYAKAHPDVVKKVATAMAEANNFILNHPKQTLTIEEKLFPKISPSVLKQTLALINWNKDGLQSAQMWAQADNVINQLKFVKGGKWQSKQGVDWTNQFIDQAALKK